MSPSLAYSESNDWVKEVEHPLNAWERLVPDFNISFGSRAFADSGSNEASSFNIESLLPEHHNITPLALYR